MRGNAEPSEPGDILGYGVGIATEPVRRPRRTERDVVALVRADFDAVDAQHTVNVFGRLWGAGAVAVVGEDGEVQARTRRRERDPLAIEGSVRTGRVDVKRATQRLPGGLGCGRRGQRTRWSGDENKDGGREGRRQYKHDQSRRDRVTGQASNATMELVRSRRRRAGRSPCRFAPR